MGCLRTDPSRETVRTPSIASERRDRDLESKSGEGLSWGWWWSDGGDEEREESDSKGASSSE